MPDFDSGSLAWMIVASALVLFMTPGLAFFYGGLVRAKKVTSSDFARISLSTTIQTGYEWHEHLEAIIDLPNSNPKLEVKANNTRII